MNSCEFVATTTALACAIRNCYSTEEAGIIAALLSQTGGTLATILIQEDLCKKIAAKSETATETSAEIANDAMTESDLNANT